MRAYIDCVSSAPPSNKGDSYTSGPLRVAVLLEDDARQQVGLFLHRIRPEPEWRVDDEWCDRYGVMPAGAERALSLAEVAAELQGFLPPAVERVSFFASFHDRQLRKLLGDDGFAAVFAPPSFATCLMAEAKPIMMLPNKGSSTNYKAPSLVEAYLHFAGETPPQPFIQAWDAKAMCVLTMLRRIRWGILRWGWAPEVCHQEVS